MQPAVNDIGVIDGLIPSERVSGRRRLPCDFMAMMTRGRAHFHLDAGPETIIAAPVLIYIPKGIPHRYDPDPDSAWKNYWMLLDGQRVRQTFGDILPPKAGPYKLKHITDIERHWLHLNTARLSERTGAGAYTSLLLHQLLFELYSLTTDTVPLPQSSRIDAVVQELETRAKGSPDVDLVALARQFGFNYDNFRKQFKWRTGMGPKQYFLKLKINQARTLLMNSKLNIKQLAALTGFENQYYFSRIFRDKTGKSPTAFRAHLFRPG